MSSKFKPLLAAKVNIEKMKFPVYATPKLDGIRCLLIDGKPVSRKLLPIPNDFINDELFGYDYLDGELMLRSGDFNKVSSGIMSKDGEPDFVYYVFDSFLYPEEAYLNRIALLRGTICDGVDGRVVVLVPVKINNAEELETYMDKCLADGYEGVMTRSPDGKYKFGRSTVKEGTLLKYKRFHDDEGILVDITEKMINNNAKERDALGHAKRSSHKANKVPAGTAGSVTVEWKGKRFNLGFGPGFTEEVKQALWDNRQNEIGTLVKFSYQELSADGIPRFGKLIGERKD